MAEALLRDQLVRRGVPAEVHSAGLLDAGEGASAHGVDVLGERGLDLSGHRSRTVVRSMVGGADLVLGMARMHVREAVVMCPNAWARAFTLKELVRRGERIGKRRPDEPLEQWLAEAHAGRVHADLLGRSADDDVFDPLGSPRDVYERTVDELDDLLGRLVDLLFASTPPTPQETRP